MGWAECGPKVGQLPLHNDWHDFVTHFVILRNKVYCLWLIGYRPPACVVHLGMQGRHALLALGFWQYSVAVVLIRVNGITIIIFVSKVYTIQMHVWSEICQTEADLVYKWLKKDRITPQVKSQGEMTMALQKKRWIRAYFILWCMLTQLSFRDH